MIRKGYTNPPISAKETISQIINDKSIAKYIYNPFDLLKTSHLPLRCVEFFY